MADYHCPRLPVSAQILSLVGTCFSTHIDCCIFYLASYTEQFSVSPSNATETPLEFFTEIAIYYAELRIFLAFIDSFCLRLTGCSLSC